MAVAEPTSGVRCWLQESIQECTAVDGVRGEVRQAIDDGLFGRVVSRFQLLSSRSGSFSSRWFTKNRAKSMSNRIKPHAKSKQSIRAHENKNLNEHTAPTNSCLPEERGYFPRVEALKAVQLFIQNFCVLFV